MRIGITGSNILKAAILAAILSSYAQISSAQSFDKASKGMSAAQFLKITASPRAAAMGESSSADLKDATSLDINPAGLIGVKKQSFYFSHTSHIAETSMEYLAYSQNMGEESGVWGMAVKYFSWGKIENTDESGGKIKNLTPYDMSIGVTFATYISGFNSDEEERFVFGGTGKVIRTQIENSASAVSADVGFLTPYMFERRFRLSLSGSNIMGSLKLDKEADPLPLIIRLGSAVYISKDFTITSDIIAPNDSFMYFTLGGEGRILLAKKTELFLRGGLNTKNLFDLSGIKNITAGIGFRYYEYYFDYSISPYGELGNTHRIALSINY